jgi:RiboL-PSP-HEPN
MASAALETFVGAVEEIADLQAADRTPVGGSPIDPEVTRVVGRASVVLLSSHFERYIYAVNEEAAGVVNAADIIGVELPEKLRLVHSTILVDEMVETGWMNRAAKLRAFVKSEGWLWTEGLVGELDHRRLLIWMKAPSPTNLIRYYRHWEIPEIFDAITRAVHTKTDLRLKLQELVDKRNNIAHGEASTEATRADVRAYRDATLKFCERSDGQLSRALGRLLASPRPW